MGSRKANSSIQLRGRKYVQRFPDYFFIWPVFRQRASSFEFQSTRTPSQKVAFSPNIRYHAGLGFYLFEVGFQFIVALPPSQTSIQEFGESESFDLQANLVGKNWGLDAFTERYKGYYIEDASLTIPKGQPKEQRKDIETVNTGVTGLFFFNKRRFSVRATYNFYERQLKSAGSPFVMASFNRFKFRADSLVYNLSENAAFGDAGDFKDLTYSTATIAPGYAYTFVVNKSWFLGTSGGVGPAFNFFDYSVGQNGNSVVDVRPFFNVRLSAGYNSERFFAGIIYSYQTVNIHFENIQFTSRNGTFRLQFGYRFREVGVLKKRATEMIKPKSR